MEFRFDAMLSYNFGNENSDAGHIKRSRGPHLTRRQVAHPCSVSSSFLPTNDVVRAKEREVWVGWEERFAVNIDWSEPLRQIAEFANERVGGRAVSSIIPLKGHLDINERVVLHNDWHDAGIETESPTLSTGKMRTQLKYRPKWLERL